MAPEDESGQQEVAEKARTEQILERLSTVKSGPEKGTAINDWIAFVSLSMELLAKDSEYLEKLDPELRKKVEEYPFSYAIRIMRERQPVEGDITREAAVAITKNLINKLTS